MKGFTHFIGGIAIASFFPWSVQAAEAGNPLFFLLAGAAALLPDTLDFRFFRYIYRHQIEIMPDPTAPDLTSLVQTLAHAIDATDTTPCRIRLNTMRTGSDEWQRYTVHLHPAQHTVEATLGPVVDTGRNPLAAQPPQSRHPTAARACFRKDIQLEYLAACTIDIFDGPHLEVVPIGPGRARIAFLPWHRQWTHSFITGGLLALLGAGIAGWQAIPVIWAAHSSHVLLDQLGFMGSNLFWPFTQQRTPGLKRAHAGSTFGNFATVWLAVVLLFGNLLSHAAVDASFPPLGYLTLAGLMPLPLFRLLLASGDS